MPAQTESEPTAVSRRGYHHGDLRSALLKAARDVLENASPEAVTLKSLALSLGVSQSAPYRHFQTREAVLAAVAEDGFVSLRNALAQSKVGVVESQRLSHVCNAYVRFGVENRGVYKLIFSSTVVDSSRDDADSAAVQAFEFLLQGVSHYVRPTDVKKTAVWVWASLHGLVMLAIDGKLDFLPSSVVSEAVQEVVGSLERRGG
jgi:AcrR family transcriptional regulator